MFVYDKYVANDSTCEPMNIRRLFHPQSPKIDSLHFLTIGYRNISNLDCQRTESFQPRRLLPRVLVSTP